MGTTPPTLSHGFEGTITVSLFSADPIISYSMDRSSLPGRRQEERGNYPIDRHTDVHQETLDGVPFP